MAGAPGPGVGMLWASPRRVCSAQLAGTTCPLASGGRHSQCVLIHLECLPQVPDQPDYWVNDPLEGAIELLELPECWN